MTQPSITCPECGRTSYHPKDIEHGYCSACDWWTSDPILGSPEAMLARLFDGPAPWERMDTLLADRPSWWQRFKARWL